ncbi:hydrogenase nickel incorporation protein HypB [Thiorhodovibrio frisius]|uniref:Hydrogenase maturation factor HypB n=1 Tax=Thiorhodovibrio frisius TaxID=631362 RepID=H8Z0Y3_9GAMM|nr:hydrogenase nickel incorporation protein HypB [Thiorhodovibrio frisius]EIC22404.1 hydrogenase accessory protein HypB [Thiorhodovibrio frisius]WPL24703.1 Hydrogenase isoenzymes nickel incorporation protein HypB [Thiorhodovibrio frisius]
MCDTCGCNVTPGNAHLVTGNGPYAHTADGQASVEVLSNLLGENNHQAGHNRQHFAAHGVLAINLMSSPGAGKTSLLEATIDALGDEVRIAVIEGDLETENDAERIRAHGVPAVQIATGSACHLDAHLVHDALHELDLEQIDLLFIENVGNLVCPASFDLGQHRHVALLSVPEGDDKPAKYPVMFRTAELVLLTKTDLLPVLTDFSPERAERYLRQLASEVPFLHTAARGEGVGIGAWLDWLRAELVQTKARATEEPGLHPDHHHHHHHHHHPHHPHHSHHPGQMHQGAHHHSHGHSHHG